MASSYNAPRSDWRATGPSRSSPRAARSASWASSIPGRTRERSRSSTRTTKRAPAERANSHARSAVRRLPRWSEPVGLGANRPSPPDVPTSLGRPGICGPPLNRPSPSRPCPPTLARIAESAPTRLRLQDDRPTLAELPA